MNKIDLKCIKCTRNKIIKFEENKSKVTFHNLSQKEYECIRVDGCAITDGIRCDYLLRRSEEELEYFIELKGCNVGHAIDQLGTRIDKASKCRCHEKSKNGLCNFYQALSTNKLDCPVGHEGI